jgi:hypothetical protein
VPENVATELLHIKQELSVEDLNGELSDQNHSHRNLEQGNHTAGHKTNEEASRSNSSAEVGDSFPMEGLTNGSTKSATTENNVTAILPQAIPKEMSKGETGDLEISTLLAKVDIGAPSRLQDLELPGLQITCNFLTIFRLATERKSCVHSRTKEARGPNWLSDS